VACCRQHDERSPELVVALEIADSALAMGHLPKVIRLAVDQCNDVFRVFNASCDD
jgi:hypothetical protein